MKRVFRFMFSMMVLILPGLPSQPVHALIVHTKSVGETLCSEIVQQAWLNVDSLCSDTARNETCYGHMLLNAQPQPEVIQFLFNKEGDKVEVADLQSLRLSTMDLLSGTWGVALMKIQANVPTVYTDKNVSLLLFGDVGIENAVPVQRLVDVTPRSPSNTLNVRYGPTTQSPILGWIEPGEVITANGRLANGLWVRIELPERSISGWVYAPLLKSVDGASLDTLSEVEPDSTYYGPMQAFYFQSGGQDSMCAEAPNSGILIQTPEGVAEITLLINEVDIQLGSTVYFQAQPDAEMTISVVEGKARVTAFGQTQTAFAGTQVGVPLDSSGKASGPPTPPRPYGMAKMAGLPVEHMENPVVIAEPMSLDEIDFAMEQELDVESESGNVDNTIDNNGHPNPSEGAPPPGLESIYPPGQSELSDPPGQGGEPPGQAKKSETN